ncbi:MAG: hypothetical protein CML29_15300 [Rhizobiales bacterium]|nr:hypothetical protein [Hyphomicrobiales bacterium]MBA69133.1 hypothetical protein [Hyphomicrobiales bacterium]|tara:strand:+ start:60 stop:626 length:567 start_codon:yes stop_codon:yes gene_type:complete
MTEPTTEPNWILQPDGTYLPSRELLARVRANPKDYPDAAEDIAVMTGKSVEEVRFILDNPFRGGRLLDWVIPDWAMGFEQGTRNAAGWAVENLGSLAGIESAQDAGRFIRRDTAFDTEKGIPEQVGEVAGQIAPAVATGVLTGGTAPAAAVTGLVAGSAVSAMTYDPREPNAIDALSELAERTWTPAD